MSSYKTLLGSAARPQRPMALQCDRIIQSIFSIKRHAPDMCARHASHLSTQQPRRETKSKGRHGFRDLSGERAAPVGRLPAATVQNALRRKLQREKEQRDKLATILSLPQQPGTSNTSPAEIRTVEDLQKVIPGMPPEQQERVRRLIAEYGDQLNEHLAQSMDMAAAGSLEDELGGGNKSVEQGAPQGTEYGAAIGILQQMVEDIIDAEQEDGASKGMYDNLWNNVRIFSQMKTDPSIDPPLELLVVLFQIAKNQTDETTRNRVLVLVGDILYGYKLVRLDPYNEVDYLNALTKHRQSSRAIGIWKSRRSKKDVENSIWWLEVGSCLYQEVYDMKNAEIIAKELIDKHHYVPPKVSLRFIKRYTKMRKVEDAWRWTLYMIKQVEANGGFGEPVTIAGNFEPEEAEAVFNAKHVPTARDILACFDLILQTGSTVHGLLWFEHVQPFGLRIGVNNLLSIFRMAAKSIKKTDQSNTLKLLSAVRQTKSGGSKMPATSSNSSFYIGDNFIDQLAFRILHEAPEVQKNARFYQIWIYGLAQLGETERIYEVLREVIENQLKPSSATLHSTIKTLLQSNLLPQALGLLEKMENPDQSDDIKLGAPLPMHYALFLQYGARKRDSELVRATLLRMDEHNVVHDESINLALFHYYYRANEFAKFLNLLNGSMSYTQYSTEGYTVIWTVIRDYFRTNPGKITSLIAGTECAVAEPGLDFRLDTKFLQGLLIRMIQSADFVPGPVVYERALQTFLITQQYAPVFALLKHMGENNEIAFDPAFSFKLTALAKKMGSITRANRQLQLATRPPTLHSSLFSSAQNAAIYSIAAANSIARNGTSDAGLAIPLDTLRTSLCVALDCQYKDYEKSVNWLISRFVHV